PPRSTLFPYTTLFRSGELHLRVRNFLGVLVNAVLRVDPGEGPEGDLGIRVTRFAAAAGRASGQGDRKCCCCGDYCSQASFHDNTSSLGIAGDLGASGSDPENDLWAVP